MQPVSFETKRRHETGSAGQIRLKPIQRQHVSFVECVLMRSVSICVANLRRCHFYLYAQPGIRDGVLACRMSQGGAMRPRMHAAASERIYRKPQVCCGRLTEMVQKFPDSHRHIECERVQSGQPPGVR